MGLLSSNYVSSYSSLPSPFATFLTINVTPAPSQTGPKVSTHAMQLTSCNIYLHLSRSSHCCNIFPLLFSTPLHPLLLPTIPTLIPHPQYAFASIYFD